MVSIGLSAVHLPSVEQARRLKPGNVDLADFSLDDRENSRSIPAIQLGSVGALVVLGVLGSAGGAQAMVRRGAQCEAVDQLQMALGDRGYDVGTIDGKFGGRTEAAVRRFQQQQKLLADGIVGPATAQAMGLPPEFSCSFVAAQSVQNPVDQNLATVSQPGEFAVVTNGGALRLRKAPAGPVVGALNNGDRVTVIETADGWARLDSGAWVSRAWLQVGQRAKPAMVSRQPIAQSVPSSGTTLAKAIPGQVVQLASPEPAQGKPQPTIEPKVGAAPQKTGKIAVSLPKTEPTVGPSGTWVVRKVVADEKAVVQVQPSVEAVGAEPTPVSTPDSADSVSVNPVSATRLDLEPEQTNSRALLVAAASDSIALPSAIAPESTPLKQAELPQVVDPATVLAPVETAVKVAEPISPEPRVGEEQLAEVQPQVEAPLPLEEPVEPELVAVRSSSQSMEVATYGDRLLIRESPGGQVIGSIPNGFTISTVGEKDGWYELETGGWVMARWLRS